jgi:hypothetical protein
MYVQTLYIYISGQNFPQQRITPYCLHFFETKDTVIGTSEYTLRARLYVYYFIILYTIMRFSCRPTGSVNRINRIDYRRRPFQCLYRLYLGTQRYIFSM